MRPQQSLGSSRAQRRFFAASYRYLTLGSRSLQRLQRDDPRIMPVGTDTVIVRSLASGSPVIDTGRAASTAGSSAICQPPEYLQLHDISVLDAHQLHVLAPVSTNVSPQNAGSCSADGVSMRWLHSHVVSQPARCSTRKFQSLRVAFLCTESFRVYVSVPRMHGKPCVMMEG